MVNIILPLLLLAAAAGLWKVGFQKIPLLLVLAAGVAAFEAFGSKHPVEMMAVLAVVAAALFFGGLLLYILYLKLKTRSDLRDVEAAKQRRAVEVSQGQFTSPRSTSADQRKGADGTFYDVRYDFSRGIEQMNQLACGREYWISPDRNHRFYGKRFVL